MSCDFRVVVATLSVILSACRAPAPSDRAVNSTRSDSVGQGTPGATTSPLEEPDTTHQPMCRTAKRRSADPGWTPPVLARLAPAERDPLHRIRLEMKHAGDDRQGVRYAAWTFGGMVPGPPCT